MKFRKEFAVGAVVGAVCGIAGMIRLSIYGINKLCEDMKFEREVKSALIKTILGKDCTSYSFKRSNHNSYMDYKEGEDYKVWPKEKVEDACKKYASYKIDEKAFAVMDICGVEGLYCDEHDTLEKEFLNECTMYERGLYDGEGKVRETPDQFHIIGEKYYLYYLRGGKDDDPGAICTVEKGPVTVNYCGVFISKKPLNIFASDKDYYELGDDDWGFTDEWMHVSDFISGEGWRQR